MGSKSGILPKLDVTCNWGASSNRVWEWVRGQIMRLIYNSNSASLNNLPGPDIMYYVSLEIFVSSSHRSCFSFQASRQRAAAGQVCSPGGPALTWTLRSQRRGKVRLRLQDTSLRVSPVKVAGDQSEGGIVTHWPIRVTEIVLLNSSLFFLLSPFSLSHPGHWNNIEQEWWRPEKIFLRWYKILISDFNWITLFWF